MRGGAKPALGSANLHVKFTIVKLGAPLPDLVDLLGSTPPENMPITMVFRAEIHDGPAHLIVQQSANTVNEELTYSKEITELIGNTSK